MTKTFTTDRGVRLRTSSQRRFVTFVVSWRGSFPTVEIYKRTDSSATAVDRHNEATHRYRQADIYTVDFDGESDFRLQHRTARSY